MSPALVEEPPIEAVWAGRNGQPLTIEDYFDISERGWELVDGRLERLPVPTDLHQDLIGVLYERVRDLVPRRHVKFCGYKLSTIDGRGREPDLMYVADLEKWERKGADAADFALEVVSEDRKDHERDYVTKRAEYQAAGIPEYWIVDPQRRQVTHLVLTDGVYVGEPAAEGVFGSVVLPGFEINAATIWDEAVAE